MMKIKSLSVAVIGIAVVSFGNTALTQPTDYEMLVSSRNTHSVKRFHWPSGDYIDDLISPGSGGLNATQDLVMGPNDNILVSGRGDTSILMFDKASGNFLQQFTYGYPLDEPTKIAYGPRGNLYVSQWGATKSSVARFNGMTGEFIDDFTPNLNDPLGHTWDGDTNLYVACYGSHDVRKFDPNGNPLGVFTETGHLQGPTNLWFDGEGSLFVVDWTLGSVLEFDDSTGNYIGTFISGLLNAEGYSFGPDGNIYICDWSRNEVVSFTPDGSPLGVFTDEGDMQSPNAILFRPVQTTSINEGTAAVPNEFLLSQNYPNPLNPATNIRYFLPVQSNVVLKIYNMLGEEIRTLVNDFQSPGEKSIVWDGKNDRGQIVGSGVYIYKMQAGGEIKTKKMTLLR